MKEIKIVIMYTPPFSWECHSVLSIARFVDFWQVYILLKYSRVQFEYKNEYATENISKNYIIYLLYARDTV